MKKKILLFTISIFLVGCGVKNNSQTNGSEAQKNETEEISLYVPQTENTDGGESEDLGKQGAEPENGGMDSLGMDSWEKIDWMDLQIYTDEAMSRENSNHLNWGYLTADEEGKIYYVDFAEGVVFCSDKEGENKEIFYEGTGKSLRVSGEYLYLKNDNAGLVRIRLDSGEVEPVWVEACGDFIILQDVIYISTPDGLVKAQLDGSESEIVRAEETDVTSLTGGEGTFLMYNAIKGEDISFYFEGHLLCWHEGKEYYVEEKVIYPLLAGNWLSVQDIRTSTRHVWDMETGTDTDLGAYAQQAVSDGTKVYFANEWAENFQVLVWDGTETKELFSVEREGQELTTATNFYMYLTEEYLYWIARIGFEPECRWGYYRLADGQTGRLN
ncbi:MAG: DUF5050 domain-containing protein [Lachnospiraceae bacterium]|nr:DUF5050 domain-containing protein [Lachnospiraceae bacterium]